MTCPICKTDYHVKDFRTKSCPRCDFNGSDWNAIYFLNDSK